MYHFSCIEFVLDVYVQFPNFDLVNVPLYVNAGLAELEHVHVEHRV